MSRGTGQGPNESRLNADYVSRGFGLLKYDAIGLGEKDLSYGADYLQARAGELDLPFVCTNAVDSSTKELLFDPMIVRETDGVKVAFLAVVSPERHIIGQVESDLLEHGIELRDPTEALQEYLPRAREQADVVVLLSHCGIETSKYLAEDLPVDVVIVGHYPAVSNSPEEISGTILAMAGAQTDRYGTLDLKLKPDGSGIESFSGTAVVVKKTGAMDGELAALEIEWDNAVKEMRQEVALARQRQREQEQRSQVASDLQAHNGIYGAESCKTCHEPIYESWASTPHATAFARLAEADAWDRAECIGCHVTGASDKHHVTDINVAPELWNVQCEECHGSGLLHARDGSYHTSGESMCLKCHDSENSPDFNYEDYSVYGVH